MNWRKFWMIKKSQDENINETETYTDDGITESDETISTKKSSKNIDTSLHKLSYKRLPGGYLKFFFLLLNSVAVLAGLIAIVISTWMLTNGDLTSRLIGQRLSMTIILILGVFVTFIAFTGIIGIRKKRRYFMIFYLTCQSLALCAIFICLTISFPFFEKITKKIRDDMISAMKNYQSLDWATEAWDNTHRYLKCCGIKSSQDWLDKQMEIPQSCCSISIIQCSHMTEDIAYKSGCLKEATMLLKSYIQTASVSTLIIFPFLIISVILALGLRKRLQTSHSIEDEPTYSRRHQRVNVSQ
ncbi:CD63 antigen-like [Linepithema humile]|uniref:CD63 antigen-like n=1 Tax=Linepithema humile TaxID=83485 RepID=UPI0006232E00|nr:PREDICTED: tetraspanin-9-like [Linepithema humile]